MRLRTPVFNGVASRGFDSGHLGERARLASGDRRGQCRCFRDFTVKQGTMRITEENPHQLTLFCARRGRVGYELAMEITGTAEAPSIVFTSSPALDSDSC